MASADHHESWHWVPDSKMCWVPARLKEGEQISDENQIANPSNLDLQFDDMVECEEISTPFILWNLRKRFEGDDIYTNIANILISVNPFKLIDGVYNDERMAEIKLACETGDRLPPHVYCQAAAAYRGLREHHETQAMLISGESGAGKTEATKRCLQYFVNTARQRYAYGLDGTREGKLLDSSKLQSDRSIGGVEKGPSSLNIEQRILGSNPILEGFGNAKTNRNNNSSRFGKWMEVAFMHEEGCMELSVAGSSVQDYLLETSRVTDQAHGERNFHVFYQVCAMSNGDAAYGMEAGANYAANFHYLGAGKREVCIDGVDDEIEMEETLSAMRNLGFESNEVGGLKNIIAGLLHCGDITFEPSEEHDGSDGSLVTDTSKLSVGMAARLLGLDPMALTNNLTTKPVKVMKETVTQTLNPLKAAAVRDSLTKAAYGRLFKWLVQRVNIALRPADNIRHLVLTDTPVGILDIFGFELFEHNRFEQLCINYANEKLQQHFTRHVFKMQEELYANEGIDFSFPHYGDNTDILDLIEAKHVGIMPLLDEQLKLQGSATDHNFLQAVTKSNRANSRFKVSKVNDGCFTIIHYAGKVTYDTKGFVVKNQANLDAHLEGMLRSSSASIVQHLGDDPLGESAETSSSRSLGGHKGVSKRETQISYFRKSLDRLIDSLERSEPHFIRCIKPNGLKKAKVFESATTLEQLKYSGVVEAVQICKMGFPFRRTHEIFQFRYWHLLQDASYPKPNSATEGKMMEFKQHLVSTENSRISAAVASGAKARCNIFHELQIGKTLILYRVEQHHALESYRFAIRDRKAVALQAAGRGKNCRLLFAQLKTSRQAISEFSAARDHIALRAAIEEAESLAFQLPELGAAVEFLARLEAIVKLRLKIKQFLAEEAQRLPKTPEQVLAVKHLAGQMMADVRNFEMECDELSGRCAQALEHINAQLFIIDTLTAALDASIKDGIAEHLATIRDLEAVTGPFCERLKARAVKELGRIEDETKKINRVIAALLDGKTSLRVDVEALDDISSVPSETSELLILEHTSFDALVGLVDDLVDFNPRTPEGRSISALGRAVCKLRSSVIDCNWLEIKAAVIDINKSAMPGQMPHINVLEELRAAQMAIDVRDNIPTLTSILRENVMKEDPGVGTLEPTAITVDHMVEQISDIQALGTCTTIGRHLLEQCNAVIDVRRHWCNEDWESMEVALNEAMLLEDSRYISIEMDVAVHEVFDRNSQTKFRAFLAANKMTGSADKSDKSEISSDRLKDELAKLKAKNLPQSAAMATLAFTASVVSEVRDYQTKKDSQDSLIDYLESFKQTAAFDGWEMNDLSIHADAVAEIRLARGAAILEKTNGSMQHAISNGQIRGIPGRLEIDDVDTVGLRSAIDEVKHLAHTDKSFTDLVVRAIQVAQFVCELREIVMHVGRNTAGSKDPDAYKQITKIIGTVEQNYGISFGETTTIEEVSDSLKPVADELKLLKFDGEFQDAVFALKTEFSRGQATAFSEDCEFDPSPIHYQDLEEAIIKAEAVGAKLKALEVESKRARHVSFIANFRPDLEQTVDDDQTLEGGLTDNYVSIPDWIVGGHMVLSMRKALEQHHWGEAVGIITEFQGHSNYNNLLALHNEVELSFDGARRSIVIETARSSVRTGKAKGDIGEADFSELSHQNIVEAQLVCETTRCMGGLAQRCHMSINVLVELRRLVGRQDWKRIGDVWDVTEQQAAKKPWSHALIDDTAAELFLIRHEAECRACFAELQKAIADGHLEGEPGSVDTKRSTESLTLLRKALHTYNRTSPPSQTDLLRSVNEAASCLIHMREGFSSGDAEKVSKGIELWAEVLEKDEEVMCAYRRFKSVSFEAVKKEFNLAFTHQRTVAIHLHIRSAVSAGGLGIGIHSDVPIGDMNRSKVQISELETALRDARRVFDIQPPAPRTVGQAVRSVLKRTSSYNSSDKLKEATSGAAAAKAAHQAAEKLRTEVENDKGKVAGNGDPPLLRPQPSARTNSKSPQPIFTAPRAKSPQPSNSCNLVERRVIIQPPDELRVLPHLPKVLKGPFHAAHLILEVRRGLKDLDWDCVEAALINAREKQNDDRVTLQNESLKEIKRCEQELYAHRVLTSLDDGLRIGGVSGEVGNINVSNLQMEKLQDAIAMTSDLGANISERVQQCILEANAILQIRKAFASGIDGLPHWAQVEGACKLLTDARRQRQKREEADSGERPEKDPQAKVDDGTEEFVVDCCQEEVVKNEIRLVLQEQTNGLILKALTDGLTQGGAHTPVSLYPDMTRPYFVHFDRFCFSNGTTMFDVSRVETGKLEDGITKAKQLVQNHAVTIAAKQLQQAAQLVKIIRSNLSRLNSQHLDESDRNQYWRAVKQNIDYINKMFEEDAFDAGYAVVAHEVREVECEFNVYDAMVLIKKTLESSVGALKRTAQKDMELSIVSKPAEIEDHRCDVQESIVGSMHRIDNCIKFATHEALFFRTNKPAILVQIIHSANVVLQCRVLLSKGRWVEVGKLYAIWQHRSKELHPLATEELELAMVEARNWWVIDVTQKAVKEGAAMWDADEKNGFGIQLSSIHTRAIDEAIARSREGENMIHLRAHAVQAVMVIELVRKLRKAQSRLSTYNKREVDAVEVALHAMETFMRSVWGETERNHETSLWPAHLEDELDAAMNDLADAKVTRSLTKALHFGGIYAKMENEIDYSGVKVAELAKGLDLAPKMGAPHTPRARQLMSTGIVVLDLRKAQIKQPPDFEKIRTVLRQAESLGNIDDLSKMELSAAKVALEDNDIIKILTDALQAFHEEGGINDSDIPKADDPKEDTAEAPRKRSYSAQVMRNVGEFDLETIDVAIISKAILKARRIGEGTCKEARKMFVCVSALRDLRVAMKQNDWMSVKEIMDRMHAFPDGIHDSLVIEVGFAEMQLQLYQNVIELQKAGQGGAAVCTWGFIDDASIATAKLGDAIDLANAVDSDTKRVEGLLRFGPNAAPKHVHEHVEALVKEAVVTLEVRLALKNDSRSNESVLKQMLAPYGRANRSRGDGSRPGRRGSILETHQNTFRFGPELKVYADEIQRREGFREAIDSMKAASMCGDTDGMRSAVFQANEAHIEKCPNLHFLNAVDWAQVNMRHSILLLDATEKAWNDSPSLKRVLADAEKGHCWMHNMPRLEEARARVEVVAEVEEAIRKALSLFRLEDVKQAVLLAESGVCTDVTGFELVQRLSKLGHRTLAYMQMWAAVQTQDVSALIDVVLRTRKQLFKTRQEHDHYNIRNIPLLRDPSDFAQRMMLESTQVRATMLMAQRFPMQASLTKLPPAQAAFACRLFRNHLLGWAEVRSFSYPEVLASEWLRIGLAMPEIRDELYCQLMKQLHAPLPKTACRLWLLFLLSLESWAPSGALQSYVEFYLISRGNQEAVNALHRTTVYAHMESLGHREPGMWLADNEGDELLRRKALHLSPSYVLTRFKAYTFDDEEGVKVGKEYLNELAAEADRLEAERAERFKEWKVRFSKLSDDADALLDMRSFTQCIDRNSSRILPRDMLVLFFLIRGDIKASLRPSAQIEESKKDKVMGLRKMKQKDKSLEFEMSDIAPFWTNVVKMPIFTGALRGGKFGAHAFKMLIIWGQKQIQKVKRRELCDLPAVKQRQEIVEREEERVAEEDRQTNAYVTRIVELFKKNNTPKFYHIYEVLRQKLREAKERVKLKRFRTRRSGIGAIRDKIGNIDPRLNASNIPNSFLLLDIANKIEQEKASKRAQHRKYKGSSAIGKDNGDESGSESCGTTSSDGEGVEKAPQSPKPHSSESFPSLPVRSASKFRPGELDQWGWKNINKNLLRAFVQDNSDEEDNAEDIDNDHSIGDTNTETTGGTAIENEDGAHHRKYVKPSTPTAIYTPNEGYQGITERLVSQSVRGGTQPFTVREDTSNDSISPDEEENILPRPPTHSGAQMNLLAEIRAQNAKTNDVKAEVTVPTSALNSEAGGGDTDGLMAEIRAAKAKKDRAKKASPLPSPPAPGSDKGTEGGDTEGLMAEIRAAKAKKDRAKKASPPPAPPAPGSDKGTEGGDTGGLMAEIRAAKAKRDQAAK